jgi:hypothetical protein
MKAMQLSLAWFLAMTVFVMGCSVPRPSSISDRWLGKWNGPEGTFLQIAGGKGKYEITVRNLDGPREFRGRAVGSTIEFERDGVKEIIRATNGAETGMKWLADKSNCLTVRFGEGYCRD